MPGGGLLKTSFEGGDPGGGADDERMHVRRLCNPGGGMDEERMHVRKLLSRMSRLFLESFD
jgi:hypothetical protein